MGACFVILLYLQLRYAKSMMSIRREQFNESVFRSLDAASRNLERNETMLYLRDVVTIYGDKLDAYSSLNHTDFIHPEMRALQQRIRNAYMYEREVLDEVVLRVLYASSNQRFDERIDKEFLRQSILHSLRDNGINLTFHYRIFDSEGREVYRCPDYEAKGEDYSYSQTLFRNDPSGKMGLVSIHFPSLNRYVFEVANMIYLALLFTIFLFITFLITVYLVLRQKKVTELKND